MRHQGGVNAREKNQEHREDVGREEGRERERREERKGREDAWGGRRLSQEESRDASWARTVLMDLGCLQCLPLL